MRTNNLTRIEKLVELYYQPLFRFASRLCGSPAEAMVLTQRTFRLAFDYSRNLPAPINNRAWLFSILFNNFLEGRLCGYDASNGALVSVSRRSKVQVFGQAMRFNARIETPVWQRYSGMPKARRTADRSSE